MSRAVALVGATASGKSRLAHAVACASAGEVEVVSVDAMAVYRGMDLATAKPTLAERREVAYHLLDVLDPDEECTVALFQRWARAAAAGIASRGHSTLYVGGTGLYHRAVLDDLAIPGVYPEVRARLEREAESDLGALYDELARVDPVAAARLEPTNARRVVRALEVVRGSGRPFSSFGEGLATYGPVRVTQVGLRVELAEIDRRLETRFAAWLEAGLVEEVARLAASPRGLSRTARQAVGYRELLAHVERGEPLEACVERALVASRRLARRQLAWFARDPRVEWFEDPARARARVEAVLESAAAVRD
ncbi:MAG TPA: tRNA (adenosine(37)-N6)-dimethylallyltransferase MiaA [Acidimicrobiales bacterium]|nr:tRNA (adenosine(37)-N6)-dimethylallyltransferase MiaA [Acidimicrobiales bacterium]